jgi:hypothetical protein
MIIAVRTRSLLLTCAAALLIAGCGSAKRQSPEALLFRTGGAQYAPSGHAKVYSVTCKTKSMPHRYSCEMRYSFRQPSGDRRRLETTVPVSCTGSRCVANWDALAQSTFVATKQKAVAKPKGPSSSEKKKLAVFMACAPETIQYAKLAQRLKGFTGKSVSVDSAVVADTATLITDLREMVPYTDPNQRVQLQQYEGALTDLSTAAKDASADDFQGANESLTGVAPQLKALTQLTDQICKL